MMASDKVNQTWTISHQRWGMGEHNYQGLITRFYLLNMEHHVRESPLIICFHCHLGWLNRCARYCICGWWTKPSFQGDCSFCSSGVFVCLFVFIETYIDRCEERESKKWKKCVFKREYRLQTGNRQAKKQRETSKIHGLEEWQKNLRLLLLSCH